MSAFGVDDSRGWFNRWMANGVDGRACSNAAVVSYLVFFVENFKDVMLIFAVIIN